MAELFLKKCMGIGLVISLLIVLMISFVKADIQWGNPTYTKVYTSLMGNICSADGTIWTRFVTGGAIETSTLNDCRRNPAESYDISRILLADGKCCPKDKPICQENSSGGYNCIQTAIQVLICEDYPIDHCGDANSISREELTNSNYFSGTEYGCGYRRSVGSCVEMVDCICNVSQNGNSCKPDGRVSIWNGTATVYKEPISALGYIESWCGDVSIGDCMLDITKKDECNTTNTMVLSSTPTWDKKWGDIPSWCVANTKRLPCLAQLDFISPLSIVLAVVLIVVLYYYLSRKKVKAKKK